MAAMKRYLYENITGVRTNEVAQILGIPKEGDLAAISFQDAGDLVNLESLPPHHKCTCWTFA